MFLPPYNLEIKVSAFLKLFFLYYNSLFSTQFGEKSQLTGLRKNRRVFFLFLTNITI